MLQLDYLLRYFMEEIYHGCYVVFISSWYNIMFLQLFLFLFALLSVFLSLPLAFWGGRGMGTKITPTPQKAVL